MKIFLAIFVLSFATICKSQTSLSDVWINEFHYDGTSNYGTSDVNEFVEVVMKNTYASNAAELAKYKIVLYTSGALDNTAYALGRGLPYNTSSSWFTDTETTHALTSFTACPVSGTIFTILSKPLPILQDVPAAIALVYDNTVVQLLSYEKSFKMESAARGGGVAAGLTSTLITKTGDLPVMETALTPTTHSISLLGTGSSYNNFTWDDGPTVMGTPCALNTDGVRTQSFFTPLPAKWISVSATGGRDQVNVQWKVSANEEVNYYELEMASINGDFQKAGEVNARSSNTGNYQSTINNVRAGSYKVRIKSVLRSGEVEYSEVRVVRMGTRFNPVLSVFPNPVKGNNVNIQIIPVEKTSYTVQLIDQAGRVIMARQTAILEANSLNNIAFNIQLLAQGIYNIKIISPSDQHTTKIIVMK